MKRILYILTCWSLASCAQPTEWVEPIHETCAYASIFETSEPIENVELVTLTATYTAHYQALSRERGTLRYPFALSRAEDQFYLLNADGDYILDARNPLSVNVNGREWSYLPAAECERPHLKFVRQEFRGSRRYVVVQLIRIGPKAGLDPTSIVATTFDNTLPTLTIDDQILVDLTDLDIGKHLINIQAKDEVGRSVSEFTHPIWIEAQPFAWQSSLMYQVLTDRFAGFPQTADVHWDIGKRRGGTWSGVQEKIEAGFFDDMGVNAIWISPINRNAEGLWVGVEGGPARYEGYHGYWRVSNTELEPAFGTPEAIKSMVKSAHQNGIRVILDIVLNHQHEDFVDRAHSRLRANQLCICGTATCPWWRDIERCWFTPYLPDIDYSDLETVQFELDRIISLVKTYNFDGLRVDAVPMMPRFVTRHLKWRVQQEFEGLGTPFLLIGETFTAPDGYEHIRYYLGQHGLDGQFDFPLMWALRSALGSDSITLRELVQRWRLSQSAWAGSGSTMGLMIGNHDVPRFTNLPAQTGWSDPWQNPPAQPESAYPYERNLLAQSVVLALPGISTLYYGDELGMVGGPDPDNRRPYPWFEQISQSQEKLRSTVARFGKIRQCLGTDLDEDVAFPFAGVNQLAIARFKEGYPRLLVVLNRAEESATMNLAMDLWKNEESKHWIDQVNGTSYHANADQLTIPLAANETKWLLLETDPCEGMSR